MMARRTGPMLRLVPLGSQRTPLILTVGLLVGGPLPRRARVTEVDLDVEGVFDVGPAGHLASLVPGEGAHEVSGLAGERRGDRGGDAGSVVAVGQRRDQGLAADSLGEGDSGGAVVLADDEVSLPVARLAAARRGGGPVRYGPEIAQRTRLSRVAASGLAPPAAPWQQPPAALGKALRPVGS